MPPKLPPDRAKICHAIYSVDSCYYLYMITKEISRTLILAGGIAMVGNYHYESAETGCFVDCKAPLESMVSTTSGTTITDAVGIDAQSEVKYTVGFKKLGSNKIKIG